MSISSFILWTKEDVTSNRRTQQCVTAKKKKKKNSSYNPASLSYTLHYQILLSLLLFPSIFLYTPRLQLLSSGDLYPITGRKPIIGKSQR
jgi:hypothetical protein